MMRVLRALFGKSQRQAVARAELHQHKADQGVAMAAINLKVDAMKTGATRITRESARTQEAAAVLMARLREDLAQ